MLPQAALTLERHPYNSVGFLSLAGAWTLSFLSTNCYSAPPCFACFGFSPRRSAHGAACGPHRIRTTKLNCCGDKKCGIGNGKSTCAMREICREGWKTVLYYFRHAKVTIESNHTKNKASNVQAIQFSSRLFQTATSSFKHKKPSQWTETSSSWRSVAIEAEHQGQAGNSTASPERIAALPIMILSR